MRRSDGNGFPFFDSLAQILDLHTSNAHGHDWSELSRVPGTHEKFCAESCAVILDHFADQKALNLLFDPGLRRNLFFLVFRELHHPIPELFGDCFQHFLTGLVDLGRIAFDEPNPTHICFMNDDRGHNFKNKRLALELFQIVIADLLTFLDEKILRRIYPCILEYPVDLMFQEEIPAFLFR